MGLLIVLTNFPRTHDELLAQMSGHDDEEPSDEVRLLAMPIVHGPAVANFNKPAKLRFFAGNLQDLQEEMREESEVSDVALWYLVPKYFVC